MKTSYSLQLNLCLGVICLTPRPRSVLGTRLHSADGDESAVWCFIVSGRRQPMGKSELVMNFIYVQGVSE